MKYMNFIMKLFCFLVIIGALFGYQKIASERAASLSENEAAVAEAESHNAQILRSTGEEEESSLYQDGIFTGEGTGFGGKISVEITITDGIIETIEVPAHSGEDPAYYSQAEKVLDEIIKSQSADVDTVSGATFSSGGLIEAAKAALAKAVN